jgi:hypothetical protein
MMQFLPVISIFGYIAYKDYHGRLIPDWAVASSWLVYGLALAFFQADDLVSMLLAMAIPIFGLGFFWGIFLIIEKVYHDRLIPRKFIKGIRFGQADVFILPLQLAIMAQFGGAICVVWALGTYGYASLWFRDLKPDDMQRRKEIPCLTFSFIAMIVLIFGLLMLGG